MNLKIKGFGSAVMISVLTSSTSCAYLHITVTAGKQTGLPGLSA